eukprot:3912340-Karenia_brevis.AAC.1
MQKIKPRWEDGTFVGVSNRANELKVVNKEAVCRVRSVMRIPFHRRWGDNSLGWIERVPWHEYKDAPDADGDILEGVTVDERGRVSL